MPFHVEVSHQEGEGGLMALTVIKKRLYRVAERGLLQNTRRHETIKISKQDRWTVIAMPCGHVDTVGRHRGLKGLGAKGTTPVKVAHQVFFTAAQRWE